MARVGSKLPVGETCEEVQCCGGVAKDGDERGEVMDVKHECGIVLHRR